jgi:hypothetical protein
MKMPWLIRLVSACLLVVFPLGVFAADTPAMLMPQGAVNVNGNGTSHSTVVFNGDRITTGDGSGAITVSGSTITIAPKSSAIYGNRSLQINAGGASVITTSGISGKLDNLTIVPVDSKAKYDFVRNGNTVMIAALQGQLRISDGRQQMLLDAGNAVSIADSTSDAASPDPDTKLSVSNARAVVIAAVAIAAGAGLSYGLVEALTPKTASPTH